MSDNSLPEGDADTDSNSSQIDEPFMEDSEAAEEARRAADKHSGIVASTLGAKTAFQLDTNTRAELQKQFQTSASLQPEVLASMRAFADSFARITLPPETFANLQSTLAAAAGRITLPPETFADFQSTLAAAAGRITLPPETFADFQSTLAAAAGRITLPEHFWEQLHINTRLLSESVSIPSLYTAAQLEMRNHEQKSIPRSDRSAETFFDEHSAVITDVRSLLKALSVIQDKHHVHRLVWRGQQDTAWPVHSSLYRKVQESTQPSEEELIAAEMAGMHHAGRWGQNTSPALKFFADLQHYGAPTRLLDASLDPEIATWFATEADPALDEKDGRVVAWGRAVRTTARKVSDMDDPLSAGVDVPFWHSWTTDEERGLVGWGTGSRTWSWFPPALSDRMRAQRAGFLLEAAPLITPKVAQVLSDGVTHDWRVSEITRATSIIGLPSRHDVRTKPNEANMVPIFSLRITASAKPTIREYLERKGLSFPTVYPDRGGLVNYLKGPFGLSS
ncbi:FRG domain-containing protein [Arthrobacter sp. TMP15]|uniref:FRG domain-containing protein n=1 Tax=Arthrobacter sp. TMP15 TaxID=3140789 RepID=UPI0031BA4C80